MSPGESNGINLQPKVPNLFEISLNFITSEIADEQPNILFSATWAGTKLAKDMAADTLHPEDMDSP